MISIFRNRYTRAARQVLAVSTVNLVLKQTKSDSHASGPPPAKVMMENLVRKTLNISSL
jgi:hypothetical protein